MAAVGLSEAPPFAARRPRRADFPRLWSFPLRWRDEDVYGHLNNVVYGEYFDTVVALWLRESGALPVPRSPVVGLVAETRTRFWAPVSFPGPAAVGLSLARAGRTSVVYDLALFGGQEDEAAALCRFAHVYVDAETRRPVLLPDSLSRALDGLSRL